MKPSLHPFRVLFLTGLVFAAVFEAPAQTYKLPADLSEKSTLAQVIAWLDKNGFADARVGLSSSVDESYDPATVDTAQHSEWAVFSKGFRFSKNDGCNLVLKNGDIKLLSYTSYYNDNKKGSLINFRNAADEKKRYSGELYISLERLSYKKTKIPYRHAKKAEEEALLGIWRTEFTGKGDEVRFGKFKLGMPTITVQILYDVILKITGAARDGSDESFNSDTLSFTFDDQTASENFYAAFRQAVKLCRD